MLNDKTNFSHLCSNLGMILNHGLNYGSGKQARITAY